MTYVVTAAGKKLSLLEPAPKLIEFRDIAEGLHRIARYGALPMPRWSVAQHTLLVALISVALMPEAKPWALLHDAHERFLGDWITPVKLALAFGGPDCIPDGFKAAKGLHSLERRMAEAIHFRAGISFPPPPQVAEAVIEADRTAYVTEVKHLIEHKHARHFETRDFPEACPLSMIDAVREMPDPAKALADSFETAFWLERPFQ